MRWACQRNHKCRGWHAPPRGDLPPPSVGIARGMCKEKREAANATFESLRARAHQIKTSECGPWSIHKTHARDANSGSTCVYACDPPFTSLRRVCEPSEIAKDTSQNRRLHAAFTQSLYGRFARLLLQQLLLRGRTLLPQAALPFTLVAKMAIFAHGPIHATPLVQECAWCTLTVPVLS